MYSGNATTTQCHRVIEHNKPKKDLAGRDDVEVSLLFLKYLILLEKEHNGIMKGWA